MQRGLLLLSDYRLPPRREQEKDPLENHDEEKIKPEANCSRLLFIGYIIVFLQLMFQDFSYLIG
jgi:hypothetical protein